MFTEKNGILIKEREQQAIVGHTLLEKRVRRVYILYKSEYSHECIYITKYFLLIFLCKTPFKKCADSVKGWWGK